MRNRVMLYESYTVDNLIVLVFEKKSKKNLQFKVEYLRVSSTFFPEESNLAAPSEVDFYLLSLI